MKSIAEKLCTSLLILQETTVTSIQLWTIKRPKVILEMHHFPKEKKIPPTILNKFQEILLNFPRLSNNLYGRVKKWEENRICSIKPKFYQKQTPCKLKSDFHCRGLCDCVSCKLISESKLPSPFRLTLRSISFGMEQMQQYNDY